jgi:alpha-1,2-mannosyltransferase
VPRERAGRRSWLPFATILIGAAAVLLALLFTGKVSRKMPDFEVYWTAAVRARTAEPLYRADDGHYQFKYLPAFAVLAIPAGFVPLPLAKAVWFTISILLLAALVALSLALLPEARKPPWLLVTIALVAMLKFFGHEVVLGQMNALLAVIVVLALLAIRGGREPAAGLLVALAVVVKPYAIIFLPWLMARRRRGAIAAAIAGLAVVMAAPALVYGARGNIELHRSWWRTVIESTAPNLTNSDNVSIAAMYAKWIGLGNTATVLTAATIAVLLAAAAFVFLRRGTLPFPEGLEGALLLTYAPLLSPQGWDYVFLVSTPAIVFLANYEDRLPLLLRLLTVAAVATIGLSLYDLVGRAAYSAFMAWSVISVCYFVVIAALCALRVRAVA